MKTILTIPNLDATDLDWTQADTDYIDSLQSDAYVKEFDWTDLEDFEDFED